MRNVRLIMRAKCTTCGRVYEHTPELQREAREFGCAMSPCHMAVATVERVELKTAKPLKLGRVRK